MPGVGQQHVHVRQNRVVVEGDPVHVGSVTGRGAESPGHQSVLRPGESFMLRSGQLKMAHQLFPGRSAVIGCSGRQQHMLNVGQLSAAPPAGRRCRKC